MPLASFLLALAALAPLSGQAQTGQGYPTTATALTTSTTTIAPSATNAACTSQAFTANGLTGFAVMPSFQLSGTGVQNVTFNFAASTTGTGNWTTSPAPLSVSVPASGTNAVLAYVDCPPHTSGSGSANAPYWQLQSVTNANAGTSGTLTINSITIVTSNR